MKLSPELMSLVLRNNVKINNTKVDNKDTNDASNEETTEESTESSMKRNLGIIAKSSLALSVTGVVLRLFGCPSIVIYLGYTTVFGLVAGSNTFKQ